MQFLSTNDLAEKTIGWARKLNIDLEKDVEIKSPALLILDMQNDFILPNGQLPVWGGQAIIPNVCAAIRMFRDARLPVFFTQHFCLEPYKHIDEIDSMKYIADPDIFLRQGTKGVDIHSDIPVGNDLIVYKYGYSAFYDTPLATLLRTRHVNEVVIAGVATNICCETTAHDAFFRGFKVRFLLDGTGGIDEQSHLASLNTIKLAYGKLISTKQLGRSLLSGEHDKIK